MADRSISIRLGVNVAGFQAGMRTAQRAAQDFGSQTEKFAQKNRQSLEQVGAAGLGMGAALGGGLALAVTKYAGFDKALSGIQAATHATEADMASLRDVAVQAGADTAYSAEEAAKGIEEMAKAGVSTADIISGGLDGALALAAAGALDVGQAAELASSAMTQFGLSGQDIPHIADLLAAGAGKAQGSVEDMGMALKQAGLVADQAGLTIEETTGGLAAFASAGLTGADSGTSFKSMLQRLTPQSKEAATAMAELGISAYDSQGNFVGLSEFAGQLKDSMSGLTTEQRNAAMSTIFGSDAVRAAAVLYENGAEGVQKWEDAVSDSGYAAETAALLTDNLAGDLERLGGSFDTVFLKSGSGANDALRGLVQNLEDVVDKVGQVPEPVLNGVAAVAGLTGGALLLGGAFITVVPRIADTVGAFRDLKTQTPGATSAVGKLGRAAGMAAVALVALEAASRLAGTGMDEIGSSEEFRSAIQQLSGDADAGAASLNRLATVSGSSLTKVDGLGSALKTVDLNGFLKGLDFVGSGFGVFDTEVGLAQEVLKTFDQSLEDLVTSGNLEGAATGFRQAVAEGEKVGQSMDKVAESFPGYIDGLREIENAAGVTLTQEERLNWAMGETPAKMEAAAAAADLAGGAITGVGTAAAGAAELTESVNEALAELGVSADGAVVSFDAFLQALFDAGLAAQSARSATASYEEAIDSAKAMADELAAGTIALGDVLNANASDFNLSTEVGRAANAAFQAVASQGMAMIEAKALDGMGQPELQAQLRGTYNSLITALGGMNITGAAADALARDVLGIPDNANIDTWMSDEAKRMAQETTGAINAIPSYKRVDVDYVNTTTNIVKSIHDSSHIAEGPGGRGGMTRATGGAVYGPGTGTSDSIPARLSNGEHVLTAREVQAMGGQAAVYGFRSRLRSGAQGFAEGGAVMRSRSVGGGSSILGVPATASGPMEMTGTLVMDSGEVLGTFRGIATNAAHQVIGAAGRDIRRGASV
ncbi:phage tail tape measure protein [Arthrobacter sp. TMN-37]